MGTRRWVAELESWMRRSDVTKEDLAERSEHSAPHVLALFKEPDPNPTLALFLDLMNTGGARFHGVAINRPIEVMNRLKQIMARENFKSVTALAKVAGLNRSALSTLWNQEDPNPTLATFDRLVVALGAERDFVVVNFRDAVVAEAVVVGTAEVQAMKQEAKIRHLHSVPPPTQKQSGAQEIYNTAVEAERAAAAAREAAITEKVDELTARLVELHKKNVELEKLRDDQAAEIVRLRRSNATLERLRAEDAAEIARLTQQNRDLKRRQAADAA